MNAPLDPSLAAQPAPEEVTALGGVSGRSWWRIWTLGMSVLAVLLVPPLLMFLGYTHLQRGKGSLGCF